jgi:hypothetical protein
MEGEMGLELLVFAIFVILIVALLAWGVSYLPVPEPFNRVLMALIIILGALIIASRAGLV